MPGVFQTQLQTSLKETPAPSSQGNPALHTHDKQLRQALVAAFKEVNRKLTEESGVDCYLSGSTGVMAVLTPTHCYVGNVGDSRAILGRVDHAGNCTVIPLSTYVLRSVVACLRDAPLRNLGMRASQG
jgi:serine/threonine protein phosphatase PrpC